MRTSLTTFAIVFGLSLTMFASSVSQAVAQGAAPTAATHKVALIDMAHLFNEYQKFKDLRVTLKSEIQKKDETAKQMQKQIQTLARQLKGDTLKVGSPDYEKLENQVLSMTSQFEIFKKKAQRDFVLRETAIYKEVYLEVSASVARYASFYKYTAVLRFSRSKVEGNDTPRKLMQKMNNTVIWHDPNADITDEVLKYLNESYKTKRSQITSGPGTGTTTK